MLSFHRGIANVVAKRRGQLQYSQVLAMHKLKIFGYLNVTVVMVPIFFFMIAIQFVFANSFSIGMAYASKKGGLAAAVFSSVQIGSAALASAIASMVTVHNQIFLAYALLTLGCIAIGLVFWQRHSLYPDES